MKELSKNTSLKGDYKLINVSYSSKEEYHIRKQRAETGDYRILTLLSISKEFLNSADGFYTDGMEVVID